MALDCSNLKSHWLRHDAVVCRSSNGAKELHQPFHTEHSIKRAISFARQGIREHMMIIWPSYVRTRVLSSSVKMRSAFLGKTRNFPLVQSGPQARALQAEKNRSFKGFINAKVPHLAPDIKDVAADMTIVVETILLCPHQEVAPLTTSLLETCTRNPTMIKKESILPTQLDLFNWRQMASNMVQKSIQQ